MTKEKIKEYSINIAKIIEDKKANDVVVIDVEGITPHFDFLIIASTNSFLHLSALTKTIIKKLSEYNFKKRNSIKEYENNPWILIDCESIIIHLFTNEARNFYNLEKLWVEGNLIYGEPKYQKKILS